jgi:putative ABC transport system permease protein
METLVADIRYALRLLSKAPGFTLAVLIVIALGIGSNSAIFTLLDKTVIRPLPYADSDRLAILWEDFSAFGTPKQRVSPATFLDWRRRNQVFEEMGAWLGSAMNLAGSGAPEQVLGIGVTSNLIPMLGVSPVVGRTFSASEEAPGVREVVLSFRFWQRRYGGDRGLVGQTILMNGEKYTVIGVMPQGFHFPNRQTDYWVPFGLTPQLLSRRGSHFLKVVGRLKPGRDWQQAQADMTAVARQLRREYASSYDRVGITVIPLKEEVLGNGRNVFMILLAASGCVLLIACANVANLLLARASGRQREIAVRAALGASPMRVVRQILTENVLLSCTGGVLGLLFAHWSTAALQKLVPAGLAASVELHIDIRVLVFIGFLSVLTGVLFGLAPALQLRRSEIYGAARLGSGTMGQHGTGIRDALVVAEVAIALVLLVGAVLLIETLVHMRAVDPGFRSAGILTADIEAPQPKYAGSSKWHNFYGDVLARVRAIPGVKSAGLTSDLPYTSRGNSMSLSIEGRPQPADLGQDALFRLVSAEYLQTIGARLKAGRFIEESDGKRSLPVVVVNEALASQYWPTENALGHRIDTGTGGGTTRWMTIVGVVADIRERGLDLATKPAVYVPFQQTEITFFQPSEIAVITNRDPLSLSKELQQAVWSVDAEQPVAKIATLDAIVDGELVDRSQVLELLGTFAGLALALAALGIYGVLFYVVSQRTREIGLRMAIGATPWDVVRDILGYSARLTGLGLATGIAVATVSTRLLSRLLYEVSPVDAKATIAVSALLMLVAMLASYLPTRRAASVDPATALREDA